MTSTIFAFLPMGISGHEMIFFGIIALLLFGKRLPEVARSLGKGVTEFKRGISGIETELRSATTPSRSYSPPSRPVPDDNRIETSAPKFEPPTQAPIATSSTDSSSAATTGTEDPRD